MQSVLDALPAGILVWDLEGRILFANLRAERILRRPLASQRGGLLREAVRGRDGFMEGVTLVSRTEKPLTRQSMIVSLDGEPRTIGYSGGPLSGPESEPGGFVLLFQDISGVVSV